MKKYHLVVLMTCLLLSQWVLAQYSPRESMLGLRGGGSVGVTYKKFFGENFAFETVAAKDFPKEFDGMFLSALFEKHAPLAGKRFSALIGGGPTYHFKRKGVGVSGIIGFDWRILNSPINLQVDWSPAYYFTGEDGFTFINAAFSIRYILNRKKVYHQDE